MLKMIIADDERIIRETISTLIDWRQYGIELIGLCSNGIEAYDMILDESPDLVITDIRMPGLDGLELIGRVSQTDLDTQFILLSGYGEFEYAKQAMKYGVRHYLLKPCNEQQIIAAVQESSRDCYIRQQNRQMQDSRFILADHMGHNVISSIISDALYLENPLEDIIPTYEPYMDFYFTPYRLFYLFYLEEEHLEPFLGLLRTVCEEHLPQTSIYGIYVKNTLLLFLKDFPSPCDRLEHHLPLLRVPEQQTETELKTESYPDLKTLLHIVLKKIRRFSMFYFVSDFHALCTCNYAAINQEMEQLCQQYTKGDSETLGRMKELLNNVMDIRFLKQLTSSMFLKLTLNNPCLSSSGLMEWLIQTEGQEDPEPLKTMIIRKLGEIRPIPLHNENFSSMVQQIFQYVRGHLNDPALTLKYIAEQHLFMNVDYVSKRFQKETGIRFSDYLAEERIARAKEYIERSGDDRIQDIAERVGFGNNPQYFSKIFKKKTGMTPSTYLNSTRRL